MDPFSTSLGSRQTPPDDTPLPGPAPAPAPAPAAAPTRLLPPVQTMTSSAGGTPAPLPRGYGSGVAPTPAIPAGTTHTELKSQVDPALAKYLGMAEKRYSGDMGAGREIDIAGGKIREAGIGVDSARAANASMRGIGGTGVEGLLQSRDAAATKGAIGRAASDITTDAEHRRDSVLNTLFGGAGAQAADRRAQESIQLQAAEIDAQNQRLAEQAQLAKQLATLNALV